MLSVTPRDAVTLTPAAFQAIHHPLRLRRRPLGLRSGGEWTDENDVLQVMQGKLRPDGFLFVPIVGGSGTGKSHLVRWAREHLEDTTGWEVRYLPKNRTNIRKVIEEVIRGLTGPAIDAAREALAAAPGSTEKADVLAERLLDELALLVSHLDENEGGSRSEELALFVSKRRHHIVDLLRDPVVRRRLTASGSVVPRLVELAMSGRRPGDGLDDDAVHISAADLPLEFEELATATQDAREFLTKMKTIPRYLTMVVDIINEVLPAAVRRVFVSSQIDLVDVFRDVRRAMLDDGKELALFIEDLTVLHGVEREFLDAIVEPATVAGRPVMANLRILFAVTEGHFDGLDTVRTRCDDAFWLDAAYDAEEVSQGEAASFVGRYFNASRLNPAKLEASWLNRQDDRWLANACDGCEFREPCHSSFGATAEGYGLYPLNDVALDHLVRVLSPDQFDPRRLVAGLANRFLLQAGRELKRDEFPSPDLLTPFNDSEQSAPVLEPLRLSELKDKHPSQAERLTGLLRYWEFDSWPQQRVSSAFGLPVVEWNADSTSRPSPGRKANPTADSDGLLSALRPAERKAYDALKVWPNTDLNAPVTNTLRKLIHSLVTEWLQSGPDPLNLGPDFDRDRFDQEKHVSFEGSVSQNHRDSSIIRVKKTPENAAALQGLLLLGGGAAHTFEEIPSGQTILRLAASTIEKWAQLVRDRLGARHSEQTAERVRFLVVIARVLGCDQDAKEPEDLLASMFRLRHHVDGVPAGRSMKWQSLVADAQRLRPNLITSLEVEFGESRGRSGGIRAVRGDQLLAIIESLADNWELRPELADLSQFWRSLIATVESDWNEMKVALEAADRHLDPDRSIREQIDKCLESLDKASELGRGADDVVVRQVRQLAAALPAETDRIARDLRALLLTEVPLPEKLRCCAGPAPEAISNVSRVVKSAEGLLASVEQDVASRQRNFGEALNASVVVARVLASTSSLTIESRRLAQ